MEWPQNPNLQDIQSLPPLDDLTEEEKRQLLNVGTRAVTTPLYPVSALAEALRGFGADLPVEDFVGTQEWAQEQLGGDPAAPENLFADFGTPDPMDASRMARLFTDPAMAMTLFHGSPHKWDRVDLSKIGTGEGVQAYGHGFYAAERPGIAKTYAEQLSERKDPVLSWKGQSRQDLLKQRQESQRKYLDEVRERGGIGKWSNAEDFHSVWFRNRPIHSYPKEVVERIKQQPVPDVEEFRKFVVESELDGLQWDYDMLSNIKRGDWSMADWLDYRQTVYSERYEDALRRYNAVMDAKKNGSAQVVEPIFRDGKKTGGRTENFREELVDDASIELQKAALNKEAIDGLSPDDFSISQPEKGGYFYELDVPDEHIERMVDWDAPLSEQPHVKAAVERAIAKEKEYGYVPKSYQVMDSTGSSINVTPDNLDDIDGAAAYHVIASTGMVKTGGNARDFQVAHGDVAKEAASQFLREQGIPGIRYWDGVSRRPARQAARAQGGLINPLVNALRGTEEAPYTRNFVIFDENAVTPLKRNEERISPLFQQAQIEALRNTNPKSKDTLIYMSPDEFLSMAAPLKEPDPQKLDRVRKLYEEGKPFSDLPFLKFENRLGGEAQVFGHEGRHRAMVLREMGVDKMPVRLQSIEGGPGPAIRWGEQSDPDSYDLIHPYDWPVALRSEKGENVMDFPIQRPLGPEYTGRYGPTEPPKPKARKKDALDDAAIEMLNKTWLDEILKEYE